MPLLHHFSEEPGIEVFHPRPRADRPAESAVWAIQDDHQAMYLFPRDCPRILLWPISGTTDADRAAWFAPAGAAPSAARAIAYVEYGWLPRIAAARLWRYEMPDETFEPLNDAGMWVSRATVAPRRADLLADLFGELSAAGVELRAVERLTFLRGIWERTTLHVSGIRLRNARGWADPAAGGNDESVTNPT